MAEQGQAHAAAGTARGAHEAPATKRAPVGFAHPRLFSGGTGGNELLTVQVGAVLFVGLAVLGVTIIRIGQLTWLHLFLGLLLIGPVLLKMSSTGYRFARYYSGDAAYRRKGPPAAPLRLLAPVVVLSTIGVFATGVVLLALGPSSRPTWLLPHKVTFFVWLAAASLHVLGHLPEMRRGLLGGRRQREQILSAAGAPQEISRGTRASLASRALAARLAGGPARSAALAGALLAGLALALALIPHFGPW